MLRHTGGTVGFSALLELWPDDGLAVAICQNGSGTMARWRRSRSGRWPRRVATSPRPTVVGGLVAAELAGTYVGTERSRGSSWPEARS